MIDCIPGYMIIKINHLNGEEILWNTLSNLFFFGMSKNYELVNVLNSCS